MRVLGYGDFRPGCRIQAVTVDPRLSRRLRLLRAGRGQNVLHDHSGISTYPHTPTLAAYVEFLEKWADNFVMTLHDGTLPERYELFSREDSVLARRVWAKARVIFAMSEPLADFLSYCGVPRERIDVRSPILPLLDEMKTAAPRELASLAEGSSRLIALSGPIRREYDFLTGARVFARLAARDPGVALAVFETGFSEDPTYRSLVEEAVRPVADRVVFMRDRTHGEFLASLPYVDVLVRGTRVESYGMAKVEAIMEGVAVVATQAGQTMGTIPYDFGDEESLLDALKRALERGSIEASEASGVRAHYEREASDNLEAVLLAYRGVAA